MPSIKWTSQYELGIPELDAQHRYLIERANAFFEAVASGASADESATLVEALLAYAWRHFTDEERYFAEFNLPDLAKHREAHAQFIRDVRHFAERLDAADDKLAGDILVFLTSWIRKHVGQEDRSLVLVARRARAASLRGGIGRTPRDAER